MKPLPSGHPALPGAEDNAIETSTHQTESFVELTDNQHRNLTVVDVTDPSHPKEVNQFTLPAPSARGAVEAMTGNVVLLTQNAEPAVASHVSAIQKEAGGMICLTDADGLWILKQHEAPDRKPDAAYRDYILFGSR